MNKINGRLTCALVILLCYSFHLMSSWYLLITVEKLRVYSYRLHFIHYIKMEMKHNFPCNVFERTTLKKKSKTSECPFEYFSMSKKTSRKYPPGCYWNVYMCRFDILFFPYYSSWNMEWLAFDCRRAAFKSFTFSMTQLHTFSACVVMCEKKSYQEICKRPDSVENSGCDNWRKFWVASKDKQTKDFLAA